jgi:DNA-binding MarR family transcriptional regulator
MYHRPRSDDQEDTITVTVKGSDLSGMVEVLRQLLAQFEILAADQPSTPVVRVSNRPAMREWARRILALRRARISILNKSMFGEPAWEMLLELYVNKDYGARLSVGRLSELSGAPATTALRWLDYLEKEKLVAREPNPTDRRTEFVELTEKGCSAMEQYLSETLETLL